MEDTPHKRHREQVLMNIEMKHVNKHRDNDMKSTLAAVLRKLVQQFLLYAKIC